MNKSILYSQKIGELNFQFDYIKFAFAKLPSSQQRAFLTNYRNQKHVWAKEVVNKVSDDELIRSKLLEKHKKYLAKKYKAGNLRFYGEFSMDSLNQSELLLMIAYFESFLKDFHRELLVADNKLIAAYKPKADVRLETIFSTDYRNFVKGEIEKQVKELDKQRFEVRARIFKEILGIKLADEDSIIETKRLFALRNRISHEIASSPITESANEIKYEIEDYDEETGTFVSDKVITVARKLLTQIPINCWSQAADKYPQYFPFQFE
jgi:hypothetical protein